MECKYTITGNLFPEIVLHSRELLFIPRMCECRGVALDDITLVIHSFNNTVCRVGNCILSYPHTYRHCSKVFFVKILHKSFILAGGDLYDFLLNIAEYVIGSDVVLRDGETIGFSEEQKRLITRSEGVSVEGSCQFYRLTGNKELPVGTFSGIVTFRIIIKFGTYIPDYTKIFCKRKTG